MEEKYLGPLPKYNSLCGPPPTYLQVQMGKMDQWNQHSVVDGAKKNNVENEIRELEEKAVALK